MSKLPLRAALSGCGGISALTLDAAARSPDFEVAALMDPSADSLQEVGERYGISRRHDRFEELLTADVDFVIVNGPNHVHLEQVRAAATAGKHCLVQKPMARDAGEAEAMVETARRHGVKLGVTMFELGQPIHHELKRMLCTGWFGDPVIVQAVAAHDLYLDTPPPEGDWRRDPAKVGGGAFIQLAVHQVNLACWLLDTEVDLDTVRATGSGGHTVFTDETTLASLRFACGVEGHFTASYATSEWSFSLHGTRGRCRVTGDHVVLAGRKPWDGDILGYDSPGTEAVIPTATLAAAIASREGTLEVHGAFARWVAGGEEYLCPGEHGLRDLKVVEAVDRAR